MPEDVQSLPTYDKAINLIMCQECFCMEVLCVCVKFHSFLMSKVCWYHTHLIGLIDCTRAELDDFFHQLLQWVCNAQTGFGPYWGHPQCDIACLLQSFVVGVLVAEFRQCGIALSVPIDVSYLLTKPAVSGQEAGQAQVNQQRT